MKLRFAILLSMKKKLYSASFSLYYKASMFNYSFSDILFLPEGIGERSGGLEVWFRLLSI